MSLIDDTADRFLRFAASRWPAELREDQSREWAAELYAIRHDGEDGRWRRAWTQLRFSLSLAASPPVDDPDKIPKGWRELLPGFGSTIRRVLMLGAVGAGCGVASTLTSALSWNTGLVGWRWAAMLLLAAVTCELGRRLGRIAPWSVRPGARGNALATAAAVLLPLVIAMHVSATNLTDRWTPYELAPYLVWLAGFLGFSALLFRLARDGSRLRAWLVGIGGGLVAFELLTVAVGTVFAYVGTAAYTLTPDALVIRFRPGPENLSQIDFSRALSWFPDSVLSPDINGGGSSLYLPDASVSQSLSYGLMAIMPGLLAAAAFAVGYLISSARHFGYRAAAPVDTSTPVAAAAVTVAPRLRILGLAMTAVGIFIWAQVLSVMPKPYENSAWVPLRESAHWAIVLAALGLVLARLGRPLASAAGLGFGVVGLFTGVVVDRADGNGLGVFLLTAGIGGALAVAAWLVPRLAPAKQAAPITRRTMVAVAVFAAYCAPAALGQARFAGGVDPDLRAYSIHLLPILWTVLGLGFLAMAVAAAAAARAPRLSRRGALLAFAPPVLVMAALCWSTQYDPMVVSGLATGVIAIGPLSVYLVAVIQWGRAERGLADVLRWGGVVLAATALALPLYFPQIFISTALGDWLIQVAAPEVEDGFGAPMFVGPLLAGAVLASFYSWWTHRSPAARPVTVHEEPTITGTVAPA